MKPATAPAALKVQAVLGECWNSRLERARRRTLPRPSMIFCTVTSGRPVLVVASGDKGVDDKKAAAVIGEKIGRVNADFAHETTGFAIGGVPPVGHARPPIVLIDETLLRFDNIWAAAGTPYAVFRLMPADLVALTRGLVVDAANS
jgi:prolyl-tRNA editing enzyme YbaK/EbsC (Cys-tRNA(Pro) deacylase)